MRRFLLDVNVLIALIDSRHTRHNTAHEWFAMEGSRGWASCPLTQLGVLRIVGSAGYPNSPGAPSVVAASLRSLCATGEHTFWPDDLSVFQEDGLELDRVLLASQLTDSYLLSLAARQGGRLATFDRRLVTDAVPRGAQCLHVIA